MGYARNGWAPFGGITGTWHDTAAADATGLGPGRIELNRPNKLECITVPVVFVQVVISPLLQQHTGSSGNTQALVQVNWPLLILVHGLSMDESAAMLLVDSTRLLHKVSVCWCIVNAAHRTGRNQCRQVNSQQRRGASF